MLLSISAELATPLLAESILNGFKLTHYPIVSPPPANALAISGAAKPRPMHRHVRRISSRTL